MRLMVILIVIFGAILMLSPIRIIQLGSQGIVPMVSNKNVLVVTNSALLPEKFVRGKVTLYNKEGDIHVSRMIGLGGEKVKLENGNLTINGSILNEDYLNSTRSRSAVLESQIPEDFVYLMGDSEGVYPVPGLVNRKDLRGIVLLVF